MQIFPILNFKSYPAEDSAVSLPSFASEVVDRQAVVDSEYHAALCRSVHPIHDWKMDVFFS